MQRQEACQTLDEDIQKRDALLKKKEQYQSFKRQTAAKDAINQQELRQNLAGLDERIAQLDSESEAVTNPEDTQRLKAEKEDLSNEREQMSKNTASKHEESANIIREIDEKLETLQDEIDFREARIEKSQQLLRPSQSSTNLAAARPPTSSLVGPLDAELAGLPPDDAKELLTRYCDKLVRLRQREKLTAKRLTAAEAQLEERARQTAELKEVLRKQ